MPIELPTAPIPADSQDPRSLLLFGPPKVGKTSLVAELPNNLIIDLEDGSAFVNAMKLVINNLDELTELITKIRKANEEKGSFVYDYITIDTVSKLEDMILPLANQIYRNTPMGKNFPPNGNVLTLPNGAGYMYHRIAMKKIISLLTPLTRHLILVGHVREKTLDQQGREITSIDIQLTGQLRSIIPSMCDAVGYIHRKSANGDVEIDFKGWDRLSSGTRTPHIAGKEIVISKYDEESNTYTTDWSTIFKNLS